MTNKIILTSFLIVLVAGCTNSRQTASIDEVIPIDLHETVNPPTSGEDWIEHMEFIALETKPECLLGSRTKYALSEKHIAAASDNTIHIFDRQGKHINSFNKMGKGPGEYVMIINLRFMPASNEIMISDPNGRKIMVYDFEGRPRADIPVNFMPLDAVSVSSNAFAVYLGRMTRAYSEDKSMFEVIIINDQGELLKSFKPFKYAFPGGVTAVNFTGPGNQGEYYINLAYGYDIYQAGPGILFEKKYSFDYLDHSIDTTLLGNEKYMSTGDIKEKLNGFTDLDHLVINANTILFWAPDIDDKKWGYRMINRKTGNQKSIFWDENQNIGNFHGIPIPFGPNSYGDYFYKAHDALELLENLTKMSPENKNNLLNSKGFNQLTKLTEEDNPVLVLYRVKDF